MNKSEAIRAILAKQPDAPPKTILAALKKRGVKASAALVNAIKYRSPQRKVSLAQIQLVKQFSQKMRGLDAAERLSLLMGDCRIVDNDSAGPLWPAFFMRAA